jgi:single-strand DNA-binding protein
MARTLNKVMLIGRLGADPEFRYTSTGMPVATFPIATNRQWVARDGSLQEQTEWHNIVAWDKLAQICADHLTKGRLVFIEGRLQTRSWESNGQKMYRTEIVASDMLILDSKSGGTPEPDTPVAATMAAGEGEAAGVPRAAEALEAEADDWQDPDELPF